jgi:hypothetical protein
MGNPVKDLTYDIEFIPKEVLVVGPYVKYDTESVGRVHSSDQPIGR